MSLLGKVVAILNVLAALLFMYLGAIDWGKHQAQTYPVFRNELLFHGLPADEDDQGTHMPPTKLAKQIGTPALNEIYPTTNFSGGELGGDNVGTQEAEVQRVRAKVKQKIDSLDGDAAKRSYLREALLGLARNAGERSAVHQRVNDPKTTLADLAGDLDSWFEVTLAAARVAEGAAAGKDGYDVRRQAIAHLLYCLSPEPAWHDRVRAVVGLIAYTREAESQAAALEEMTRQLEIAMADDQATFERDYTALVQRLHYLADQVDHLSYDLISQKDLAEAHRVLVKSRERDVEEFTTRLTDGQAKLRKTLAKQAELETKLHTTWKNLTQAVNENIKLEKQIRDLELGQENGERP